MVLEEADGLPDNLCIHLIPEVGNTRNSRVLHQHVAKKFRNAITDENGKYGNRKQSSDAMNPGGQKGVQVNRLVSERILDQEESGIGSLRIEYPVKNRSDHECDQPFRQPDHGK